MVVLLVLLVSFLDLPIKFGDERQVLEFFAGVGRIAALAKFCGYKSSALDIRYGEERYQKAGKRSPMDINSNAGLVWLVGVFLFPVFFGCTISPQGLVGLKSCIICLNLETHLRLCIQLILNSEFKAALAVLAVVCSSMVPVNRASNGRSIMTPLGFEDFVPVRKSNKLTSRRPFVVEKSIDGHVTLELVFLSNLIRGT